MKVKYFLFIKAFKEEIAGWDGGRRGGGEIYEGGEREVKNDAAELIRGIETSHFVVSSPRAHLVPFVLPPLARVHPEADF